jgi:hypothetical protein
MLAQESGPPVVQRLTETLWIEAYTMTISVTVYTLNIGRTAEVKHDM